MHLLLHLLVRLLPKLRSQPVGNPGRVAVLTVLVIAMYACVAWALGMALAHQWLACLGAVALAVVAGWLYMQVRRPRPLVIDAFGRPDPIE